MQSISAKAAAALAAYAPVTLHLSISDAPIPSELGKFTLSAAVGDEALTVGSAIAAMAEITVESEPIQRYLVTKKGAPILTKDGQRIGTVFRWQRQEGRDMAITWDVGTGEEYGLFHGTIERVTVNAGRATIKAYDALFWAGSEAFAAQGSYQSSVSAKTVLQALAGEMGVNLNADTAALADGVTISGGFSSCADTLTRCEAAGYVAGILGGNAVIDRDGALAVVKFTKTDFATEVYAGGATAENADWTPAGLSFERSYVTKTTNTDGTTSETETIRTYAAGDGSLLIENPLADQAAATRAYTALRVASRKGSYSYPMGMQVEPGDIITVKTLDGDYPVAVCVHQMSIDGGVKSTDTGGGQQYPDGTASGTPLETSSAKKARALRAAAVSASEDISSGGSTPPGRQGRLTRRLERLEAEILKVKNLYAENAEITSANIQKLRAGEIDVGKLFANDITATGSFQVANDSWRLVQNAEGFSLQANRTVGEGFRQDTYITMGAVDGYINTYSHLYLTAGDEIIIEAPGISANGSVYPYVTGRHDLGDPDHRWMDLYLVNSPNVSSDRNRKTDIKPLDVDILDDLRPVSYRLKGQTATRYGFIAQEVETALEAAGADTADLGLLSFDEGPDGERRNYSLCYGEFVPLLVKRVQAQQSRIDTLEKRLDALERSLNHG